MKERDLTLATPATPPHPPPSPSQERLTWTKTIVNISSKIGQVSFLDTPLTRLLNWLLQ